MKKIGFYLAIFFGKVACFLTRLLGKGGGTALPGLVANAICPDLITQFAQKLEEGSIVITGTNGKTTTSRLLSSIFTKAGFVPIHNRAGSNLMRGIASTFVERSTLFSHLEANLGLWEVDEATLHLAIEALEPKVVVITNLFRDQLDRYGEIDRVASIWKKALAKLPPKTVVVLCGDDPTVASLGKNLKRAVYFGVSDKNLSLEALPHAADSKQCPLCDQFLSYQICFSSHLGNYDCPKCSFKRPLLDINCRQAKFMGIDSTQIDVKTPSGKLSVSTNLSGLYNVYNVTAAVATAWALKIPEEAIKEGFLEFRPAFGRLEKVRINQKTIFLLLSKNPTGFNEVIRTVFWDNKPKNVLIAINDLIADGRDVSWLWDVDFEKIQGLVKTLVISGLRAEDMVLRLKYAGLGIKNRKLGIEKDFRKAITLSLGKTKPGEALYILSTYTAMLEIRKVLNKMGFVHKSWED